MTTATIVTTQNQRLSGPDVNGSGDGLAGQDSVEDVEAGVLEVGEEPDQQGADVAELRPGLDHLRQAELGALGGVRRHEQRARRARRWRSRSGTRSGSRRW